MHEARDFAIVGCSTGGGGALVTGFVVEVFVGGIEGGDGDVDDFHFADGAVPATGFDEDAGHGFDGEDFVIKFDVAFAFENEIDLGHLLVVVSASLL